MPTLTITGITKEAQTRALAIARRLMPGVLMIPATNTDGTYRLRLAVNNGNLPDNLKDAQNMARLADAWREAGLHNGQSAEIKQGA